jgi:hypothetical protein
MPENDLTKFIQKKVAETGATKESVWKALDEQAELWQRRSNSKGVSPIERRELVQKVNRAGSILHYFHHGYEGDGATSEDRRLVDLIKVLPRG